MTLSPKAIEAAAEAMKLGVCQYCRQPAVGAGGGVVDCNCPYRVWDEPTDKERAQIALTAALAVDGVALQGWQPIDSAPAGIDIIGYWQNGEMHTGSTNGDEWFPMFGSDDASWSMPTHWQPLPPPPTASDREERR
jgi:hypothetical protein